MSSLFLEDPRRNNTVRTQYFQSSNIVMQILCKSATCTCFSNILNQRVTFQLCKRLKKRPCLKNLIWTVINYNHQRKEQVNEHGVLISDIGAFSCLCMEVKVLEMCVSISLYVKEIEIKLHYFSC